jgi:tetrahydromethanopterin S-methyltransferase subunit G
VDVPDIPVEPVGGSRYPGDMEARVAVLEQLARVTAASLERIELRLDTGLTHADDRMDRIERRLDTALTQADDRMNRTDDRMARIERRLDMLWGDQHSDFRWLLGMLVAGTGTILACLLGLLGVMAHGFHWL